MMGSLGFAYTIKGFPIRSVSSSMIIAQLSKRQKSKQYLEKELSAKVCVNGMIVFNNP